MPSAPAYHRKALTAESGFFAPRFGIAYSAKRQAAVPPGLAPNAMRMPISEVLRA